MRSDRKNPIVVSISRPMAMETTMTALQQITETAGSIPTPRPAPVPIKAKNELRQTVMAKAWQLWKLAQDVAKRPAYNGVAIERAALAAGKNKFEARRIVDQDWLERREARGISSFRDALIVAWEIMISRRNLRIATEAAERMAALYRSSMTPEQIAAESARIVAGVKSFANE